MTHPGRVFYPDDGFTKGDLARFYADYAEWVLPHIVDRPLAIVRCPDGIAGERFFQKHPGESAPAELRRVQIPEKEGKATYLVVDDAKGLVVLAQIAVLELHVGGARAEKPDEPDQLVFDLDPAPDVRWPRVIASAEEVREFLQELGLKSFVKTSGGKGLHVVAPTQRRQAWDEVSHFCQLVARAIERAAPERYVSKMSKAARKGKIFVDYLRNQRMRDRGGALFDPSQARCADRDAPDLEGTACDHLQRPIPARQHCPPLGQVAARSVARIRRAPAVDQCGGDPEIGLIEHGRKARGA